MGRLLGLVLFFTGIGMVAALLISDHVLILIGAALCLLWGYHLFCR